MSFPGVDPQIAAVDPAVAAAAQDQTPGLTDQNASSNLDFQHLWLLRHLQGVEKNGRGGLSAGLSFNTALLPGDIQDALSNTGQAPKSEAGNAFGEFLQSATDQHAPQVAIPDMVAYQNKLKQMGYLPADYASTGAYDGQTSSATFRYGSDLTSASQQGSGGFLTTPVGKGVDFLSSTMPSGIVKGFIGMLKGFAGTLKDVVELPVHPTEFTRHWGRDLFNAVSVLSMFDGLGEAGAGLRTLLGGAASPATDMIDSMVAAKNTGQIGMFTSRPLVAVTKLMSETGGDALETWFKANGLNAQLAKIPGWEQANQIMGGLARATVLPRAMAIFEPNSQLGKDYRAAYKVPWYVDLPLGLGLHPEGGLLPDAPFGTNTALGRVLRKPLGAIDAASLMGERPVTASEDVWQNMQARSFFDARAKLANDPEFLDANTEQRRIMMMQAKGEVIRAQRAAGTLDQYAQDATKWTQGGEGLGAKLAWKANLQGDAAQQMIWGAGHQQMDKLIEAESVAEGIDSRWRAGPTDQEIAGTMPGSPLTHAALETGQPLKADVFGNGKLKNVTVENTYPGDDRVQVSWRNKLYMVRRSDLKGVWQDEAVRAGQVRLGAGQQVEGLRKDQVPVHTLSGEGQIPAMDGKRVYLERVGRISNGDAINSLKQRWDVANDFEQASMRPEVQQALGDRSLAWGSDRVSSALEEQAAVVATDLSNHPGVYQEELRHLRELGYYPVLTSENILPYRDVVSLGAAEPVYARNQFAAQLFGARNLGDFRDLHEADTLNRWNARFHALGDETKPYGYGRVLMDKVSDDIRLQRQGLKITANDTPGIGGWAARLANKQISLSDYPVPKLQRILVSEGMVEEDAYRMAKGLHADAMKGFAAPGGWDYTQNHSFQMLHEVAQALRIHGLPGIPEYIRSIALPGPNWLTFMPEHLMNFGRALRYQLNPMFAARQYTKQQLLGMAEGLAPVWDAAGEAQKLGVTDKVTELANRLNNAPVNGAEDLTATLGGTNLRQRDQFSNWRVYQNRYAQAIASGADADTADQAAFNYVKKNSWHWSAGYGPMSPAAKSLNYMFFPFSFERKFLGTMGQYLAQEPVRALLIHETLQRYNQLNTMDATGRRRFSTILKRYAPVLNELNQLNAFSHGIGPGEFVGKHPTALAFGAVYGPLADALGHPAETLQGLLHPVAVGPDQAIRFQGMAARLVPALNAFSDFFHNMGEQGRVIMSPQHETSAGQFDDYFTLRRALQQRYIQLGSAFGAAPSISSFQGSASVPEFMKMQYLQELQDLGTRYPAGLAGLNSLTGSSSSADAVKQDILGKVHRSRAEDGVVALEYQLSQFQTLGFVNASGFAASGGRLIQQYVVNEGMRNLGARIFARLKGQDATDFLNFWRHLGYQNKYGPIATSEVPLGEEMTA